MNAASVEGHMTPVRWPLHVFKKGHITFINIFSYIRVIDMYQSLKWSELNKLYPNCNKTPLWWLIVCLNGVILQNAIILLIGGLFHWSTPQNDRNSTHCPLNVIYNLWDDSFVSLESSHIIFIDIFSYIRVVDPHQS